MLINKMIKSGLVIQNRLGNDIYPSGYTKHGRWGTEYTERPSSNDVFDTGFSTTREISPYQQSVDTFDRVVPKSVFKSTKANRFYKYKNGPKISQVAYLDIFGKKANEIVDYVGSQLKKSYFTGVPGPAGPAGPAGPSGPKGDKGEEGLQGIAGLAGEIGPIGPIGPRGEMGFTGPQGPQGIEGAQGMQGIEGAQGIEGPQGMQGIEGAQGMQGIEGPQGMQGVQGMQGIEGPQGIQGFEGSQGTQGLVGNAPSETQVQLLIENSLSNLPTYITNMLDSRLTNLPTFIQAEVVSQLQGLPEYIKSNQLSISDIAPIISGMIADASPQPSDIFTNPLAITNIPQETETGMVTIYQPERSFQSAQEPGPSAPSEPIPEPAKAPEPPQKPKRKPSRTTSLPTVVEEEAGPSNLGSKKPEAPSKKVKTDEPSKKLSEIEELKRSIDVLKKKKKLSPNQQTLLLQRENRLSMLLRK